MMNAAACLLSAFLATAHGQHYQQSQKVAQASLDFANHFEQPNKLYGFYAPDSILEFKSDLPFGGTYDYTNIDLFWHRLTLAFEVESGRHRLEAADEASGIAIIQSEFTGYWKRSGERATLVLLHVLEWDQLDTRIKTHLVLNKNIAETMHMYRTAAEKKLSELYWSVFKANPDDLREGKGPAWDMISDGIRVTVNMYPDDILSKTSWTGKQEVLEGMKEFHSKDLVFKDMAQRLKDLEFKVLFADKNEVYAKISHSRMAKCNTLAHYVFDSQTGQLVSEELTVGKPLRPWQVYPFPFPVVGEGMEGMEVDGNDDILGAFAGSSKRSKLNMGMNVNIERLEKFTQIGRVEMDDFNIHHDTTRATIELAKAPPSPGMVWLGSSKSNQEAGIAGIGRSGGEDPATPAFQHP